MEAGIRSSLPEGFERTELPYVTFENARDVLGYCKTCTKKPNCGMNQHLTHAIGDNYPYWAKEFVAVDVRISDRFCDSVTKVFCEDYQSPQLRLPGIPAFCDGIETLIKTLGREKEEYETELDS
jgi:glutaredoxin-related protein